MHVHTTGYICVPTLSTYDEVDTFFFTIGKVENILRPWGVDVNLLNRTFTRNSEATLATLISVRDAFSI